MSESESENIRLRDALQKYQQAYEQAKKMVEEKLAEIILRKQRNELLKKTIDRKDILLEDMEDERDEALKERDDMQAYQEQRERRGSSITLANTGFDLALPLHEQLQRAEATAAKIREAIAREAEKREEREEKEEERNEGSGQEEEDGRVAASEDSEERNAGGVATNEETKTTVAETPEAIAAANAKALTKKACRAIKKAISECKSIYKKQKEKLTEIAQQGLDKALDRERLLALWNQSKYLRLNMF